MRDRLDLFSQMSVGLVVIGRNEGERLRRCLASLRDIPNRVYVDSGSSDGSLALARKERFSVIELKIPPAFTAARARNAGLAQLLTERPGLEFVQMLDGDCEVQPGWLQLAIEVLNRDPRLGLVFGRRRERFPERSIYNALCDDEWNVPIGESVGCGGDALFRVSALRDVDFYNPLMIAGEDSELSYRLRKRGWRLLRLDVEMVLHDANITSFRQWWRRTKRSGHGFAEMAYLHPDAKSPNWKRTVRSIVFWGAGLPTAVLAAMALALCRDTHWWFAAIIGFGAWPLNAARLAIRQRSRGLSKKVARASGGLLMIGKFPQLLGVVGFHVNRLMRRTSVLIEYKGPENS